MQVALAWLLRRSPNILLFPGTSSVDHLRENLKAGDLLLPPKTVADLNGIAAEAEPKRSAPSVILRNTPLNGYEQKRLSNIYSSALHL
jgi:diketogulonate reductase-like aldo/keto reductase